MADQRDPFWEPEHWIEEAKQPWTWPRAFAVAARAVAFWGTVAFIAYLIATNG